jgi:hypothetical protein
MLEISLQEVESEWVFLADDDIVLSLIFYMIFFCQSKSTV